MAAQALRAQMRTAGERVELTCSVPRIARLLAEGAAGQLAEGVPAGGDEAGVTDPPDVRVGIERGSAPFDTAGWRVLTRGAWCRPGQVVIQDACSSGLDLRVTAAGPTLDVLARWRPPAAGRAAALALPARGRLLLRAVLLQYPALWRSQQRGRVPLHASVCGTGTGGPAVLLAGPGGVGKSTLVYGELARGATATCDNLCVSDGRSAWGVVEPLRLPAGLDGDHGDHDGDGGGPGPRGTGRRMPHGRREAPWLHRVDGMVPDQVIVIVRGGTGKTSVTSCHSDDAARYLAAGTFMAGELRRYWGFAATLALGTGLGLTQPPVQKTAAAVCAGLPCLKIVLGDRPGVPLRELIASAAVPAVSELAGGSE